MTSLRRDHSELLSASGFSNVEELDLTDEFLRVAQAWAGARERHADELAEVEGQADFAQRLKENKASVAALRDGLLRRSLFVAEGEVRAACASEGGWLAVAVPGAADRLRSRPDGCP